MITKIAVENFKGIGERIDIPVRPITLLFGANSAGKSTVIHALHFAREVLVRRNLDVDRTEYGGELIDLGGFRNLLHARNVSQAICLEFSIDLAERDLPTYFDSIEEEVPNDLSSAVESADIAISLEWSETRQSPFVSKYAVAVNGKPVATIRCDGKPGGYVQIVDINDRHPLFIRPDDSDYSLLDPLIERYGRGAEIPSISPVPLEELADALPMWGDLLPIPCAQRPSPTIRSQQRLFGTSEQPTLPFDETEIALGDAHTVLTQLLVGPGEVLADYLGHLRYVGPLRATPQRNYSPPRFPDESRWADGLAAWDELSRDAALTDKVSEWLSDGDRLDAGCYLTIQRNRLLDEECVLYRLLASGRAFDDADELAQQFRALPVEQRLIVKSELGDMLPQDVGVGISQLLPIAVALLSSNNRPIALEQPELHVHPRLQAKIADVLIEASRAPNDKQLFVETHSEHLILRLLRRIRETTEKDLPEWHPGLTCAQLAVIYLAGGQEQTTAVSLRVTNDGDFLDRWPNGFFEERAEELF